MPLPRKATYQQWKDTRRERREICDLIDRENCGRTTSRNDKKLRDTFGGERNLPFTNTKNL